MNVKPNMGGVDCLTRVLFAIVFMYHGLYFNWFWMFVAGVVLTVTVLRRHCPLYTFFNMSTIGLPKKGLLDD